MPCSHGNRTPRELYEKAVECRDGTFTIFGRTAEEILKALDFYDHWYSVSLKDGTVYKQEQMKMTREEAYLALAKIGCESRYGAKGMGDIILALETLGLLKFEEAPERGNKTVYQCGITESNLEALEKAGYSLLKNDAVAHIQYKDGTRIIC